MKRGILIILFYSLVSIGVLAQNNPSAPVTMPASPEAATMAKYTNFPDPTYNGVPTIQLPLYEIPSKSLKYEINLMYNAQGFRVDEEASSVGLGWNLSTTSMITRTIMGIDDFLPNGFYKNDNEDFESGSGQDQSPDVFSFNINGRVGKFLIVNSNNPLGYEIKMIEKEPMIIEMLPDTTWLITDENGIKYQFFQKERSIKHEKVGVGENRGESTKSYLSTWYISKIKTLNNDEILFEYDNLNKSLLKNTYFNTTYFDPRYYNNPCDPTVLGYNGYASTFQNDLYNEQILLKNIKFKNGSLVFNYNSRNDLNFSGTRSPKRLSFIELISNDGIILETFNFYHSYFNSASGSASQVSHRLKLDSVVKKSNLESINLFSFKYNNINLPDKNSLSKDYWGYYNGSYVFPNGLVSTDSEPDSSFTKACLISEILFSTGGKTHYEFESNTYTNFDSNLMEESPNTSYLGEYIGPGCRVSKITNYDYSNNIVLQQDYIYKNSDGLSSGLRLSGSKYSYFVSEVNSCPGYVNEYVQFSLNNYLSSSDPGSGYVIGYSNIEILNSSTYEGGKTIYSFYNTPSIDVDRVLGMPLFLNNINGKIKSISYYKFDNNEYKILLKKSYKYNSDSIGSVNAFYLSAANMNNIITLETYVIPLGYTTLSSQVVSNYENNEILKDSTFYSYDNFRLKQVVEKVNYLSDGSLKRDCFIYPFNHPVNLNNNFINKMMSSNLISVPLEEFHIKTINNEEFVVYGKASVYYNDTSLNLKTELLLNTNSPILVSNFKPSNKSLGSFYNNSFTSFSLDNRYETKIEYLSYDNFNNISEFRLNQSNDITSVKWNYNGQYPVCFVKNSSLNDFGYDSFELDDPFTLVSYAPNLRFSHNESKLGDHVLKLNSNDGLTFNLPSLNKYILSFWAKTNNSSQNINLYGNTFNIKTDWTFVTLEVENEDFISFNFLGGFINNSLYIDEVKIHSPYSQLSSYYFDLLRGLKSLSDINNQYSYFTYDNFGRLSFIKDDNGNILESFDYNFFNSPNE